MNMKDKYKEIAKSNGDYLEWKQGEAVDHHPGYYREAVVNLAYEVLCGQ